MKKFRRWAIGVLAGVVVLLAALILLRDVLLKAVVERSLQEETGLRAVIDELTTTLGSGALRVSGLKLYNPPEFGGRLMASVPELVVDLDATQAADGKLHFHELKLHLAELNVVRNAAGRLNLDGVEKRIRERLHKRRKKRGEKFEFEFAGIERLQLTVGQVLYTDLKHPRRALAINLAVTDEAVTDLETEEDLQKWASALVFRILLQVSLRHFGKGHVSGDTALEDGGVP
jgi:uncharacterized protein involved in outer membrane biogenesis